MFIKDKDTGVVINNDLSYYSSILALREEKKQNQKLQNTITDLFDELREVRTILDQLKGQ